MAPFLVALLLKVFDPTIFVQVLITGASSGIGEALALYYAQKGANVWLVARRLDSLEIVADRCLVAGTFHPRCSLTSLRWK